MPLDDRIDRTFERIEGENRRTVQLIGHSLEIENYVVQTDTDDEIVRDEHRDVIHEHEETIQTAGEVQRRGEDAQGVFERAPSGIVDDTSLAVLVSDEIDVYDGSEDDHRLPSHVVVNGSTHRVLNVWDQDDGILAVYCE